MRPTSAAWPRSSGATCATTHSTRTASTTRRPPTSPAVYDKLSTDHPIDLCRYQVINNYMGRAGLINSGGESHGAADMKDAVRTSVINKRAGGMGLISGRKSFQRPMKEGVELLHAIQDVYLNQAVTIA